MHITINLKTLLPLLLLLLAFARGTDVLAQVKNINITVYNVKDITDRDRKPAKEVIVYGFYNVTKARTFYNNCVNAIKNAGQSYFPDESEYNALGQTDENGYCMMQLPLTGYIVVRPDGADPILKEVRGMLNVEVTYVAARTFGTVIKTAQRKRKNEPTIPNVCGNRMVVGPMYYYISGDDTDSKARIIISPMVKAVPVSDEINLDEEEPEDEGELVGYLRPAVKDGVEFRKANIRRMGFDETRDPLYPYRDGTFMRSHEEDSMLVMFELEPIDRKLRYRIDALQAYGMNSNVPYRLDTVCLSEGYVKDPMRFLDYSLIEVPIDRTRYAKTEQAEFNKSHEKLYLNFVVGEARLDPADTLNFKQLEQLKDNLSRYMGADAGITSAVIHGSASPEGGQALNSRLGRERAEYLRQELGRFPALQDARRTGNITMTHKVATWEDVARLLETDSLKEEAAGVRAIIASNSDMRRQEAAIRQLPCWPVIEQRILPELRVVDIEYQYYTNRVKTPEEILEQYQTDPDYHAGRKQKPYEFYHLLGMIKDPKEKETIARAALSVKDDDGVRPWPLAAYELAKCYAARGVSDTMLLKPYIDVQTRLNDLRRSETGYSKNGWYNDEAIVTTHIKMLANAGAFGSAYRIAVMLRMDEIPEYRRMMMFLRCLNCEWNVPEVMDTVSASSYWNNIVMLAAQEDAASWGTALYMLDDATQVDPTSPEALYLKAQLRFSLDAPKRTTNGYQDDNFMFDEFFEPSPNDPTVDIYGEKRMDWGLPMVQCCLKDESQLKYMLNDGTFNKDYRKAFKRYWKKLKADPEQCRKILADLAQSVGAVPSASPAEGGDSIAAGQPDSLSADSLAAPVAPVTLTPADAATTPAPAPVPATETPAGQPVTPVPAAVPAAVPVATEEN